jgi:hypothetical protein
MSVPKDIDGIETGLEGRRKYTSKRMFEKL